MVVTAEDGVYLREVPGHGYQLWSLRAGEATRLDVTNAIGGPASHFVADEGETVWDAMRRLTPWFDDVAPPGPFVRMNMAPGQYFPRISRPLAMMTDPKPWSPGIDSSIEYLTGAQNQLNSLIKSLGTIARVVQPVPANLQTFGHEIRNLLILAATELEMHLRGVLVANGRPQATSSTRDYVRLAAPMRLQEYRVSFLRYPELSSFAPFEAWNAKHPSQSLPWYASYNAVKHDRENEFSRATLGSAFEAVAACAVMLVAQFGVIALGRDVTAFLSVVTPKWHLSDMYLPPMSDDGWVATPHPAIAA